MTAAALKQRVMSTNINWGFVFNPTIINDENIEDRLELYLGSFWADHDAVALGLVIILRLSCVDLDLLLDAPHLRGHTAHSKDGVADTP